MESRVVRASKTLIHSSLQVVMSVIYAVQVKFHNCSEVGIIIFLNVDINTWEFGQVK